MTLLSVEPAIPLASEQGFVETPPPIVDAMVAKLFHDHPPAADASLLDPGCGTGPFIDGVIRWCARRDVSLPRIVGVENDRYRAQVARHRFGDSAKVEIRERDFLASRCESFDYVIGNPPYVPITSISPSLRATLRQEYKSAVGRFDLYLLFFEKAIGALKPAGRLVFITPEKFLYVETAAPLRRLFTDYRIEELHFLDEESFEGLVTYPLVTTLSRNPPAQTLVIERNESRRTIRLPRNDASLLPAVLGIADCATDFVLADVCDRISCGVATGADSVFVLPTTEVRESLKAFA